MKTKRIFLILLLLVLLGWPVGMYLFYGAKGTGEPHRCHDPESHARITSVNEPNASLQARSPEGKTHTQKAPHFSLNELHSIKPGDEICHIDKNSPRFVVVRGGRVFLVHPQH